MTDDDKIAKGRELAGRLFKGVSAAPAPLPKRMAAFTVGHLFGDLWQGPDLPLQERSLITCTTLVALGRTEEQRLHFVGARNLGIPRAKMEEMITHVGHYAGWPCAISAFAVLAAVWPEGEAAATA